MATAERDEPSGHRSRRFAIACVIVSVIAVGLVLLVRRDDPSGGAATATTIPPVAVDAASIYEFASVEEMVAASDAIVLGEVVAVERGRLVGDPADGGVVSRIVTVAVDRVLAGDVGSTLLVEEEGWLPDGAPLIVDGMAPSAVGDRGVWFLDEVTGADAPVLLVINSQGRFLTAPDGSLLGGDQRDALVRELQRLTLDELVARIDAATASMR